MDYTTDELIAKARRYMDSHMKESRIRHTERVVENADKFIDRFGGDREKARVAAWFHDLAKNMDPQEMDRRVILYGLNEELIGKPNLAHGKIAAEIMKREFGIDDDDILNAVSYHTTARAGMSHLEKIIYLADVTEPSRTKGAIHEIRARSMKDLDEACLMAIEDTIEFVRSRGDYLDRDTVDAREYLIESINNRQKGDR